MQPASRRHLLLAAGATALFAACGGSDDHEPSVVGVAQSDGRFSILLEALQAAGLSDTLNGAGPFTVFAPTNDAFTALLAELGTTKAALLADRALLTAVLTYHVIGARVERSAVPLGKAVGTLQGGIFKVEASGSALVVTDGRNRRSTVTATDLRASNGVVHVVDRVLLPADKTIVQTAEALPQFSILVEAVVAAGLTGALSAAGPFTVFAPTNDAFAALLADRALLTAVLTTHVLPARVLKADVPVGTPVTTLQGSALTIDASLAITDPRGRRAAITGTDVLASNGVIHVIDKVLLPRA